MPGPGQTLEAWEAELERGDRLRRRPSVALPADHRGRHALPRAACGRESSTIPDGDQAADLYELTQEVTAARGLPAYEISNHARPGAESRHNLTYWRYGEYVGVGPGAHGRFVENGRRVVTIAEKMPETWANLVEARGHGVIGGEVLTRSRRGRRIPADGAAARRRHRPRPLRDACRARGFSPARLSVLQEEGLVAPIGNSRLRATPSGMIVLDAVVADLAR